MPRPKSRVTRWGDAVSSARAALDAISAAYDDMETALTELTDLKSEFEDWQSNLPENLQESALGEKLQAMIELNIPDDPRDVTYADLESAIDEAESADLPLGFGRD